MLKFGLIAILITVLLLGSNHKEDITAAITYDKVVMFPSAHDVFESEIEKCQEVMFPICSFDLAMINEEWKGNKLHLILYNDDPYHSARVPFFTEYCTDAKIAFDVNENKYRFRSDLEYFMMSEDWVQWFNETKESYFEARDAHKSSPKDYEYYGIKIGGTPDWWQHDETPSDPEGNPMQFVAEFGWGEVMFYLFYSEKHNLAVQIYQIT